MMNAFIVIKVGQGEKSIVTSTHNKARAITVANKEFLPTIDEVQVIQYNDTRRDLDQDQKVFTVYRRYHREVLNQ